MFNRIFPIKKPIIGMIHLAGRSNAEKVDRALKELAIYEEEGVDGAIIEDYHGTWIDVEDTLSASKNVRIVRGVNILRNPYSGFILANNNGAQFIQFDNIQSVHLDTDNYDTLRMAYPSIAVMGGVRFKYTTSTGKSLEEDIEDGRLRCDAIVTTGRGTGVETPIEKLRDFRKYLFNFPLIVGAGVNISNVYQQLQIADGAIVGSHFKLDEITEAPVNREKVRKFMDKVRSIRNIT